MIRTLFAALCVLAPYEVHAQTLAGSYATRDGRAATVVIACPSQDGTYLASACAISKPGSVTYSAPVTATITTANTPVIVFSAGSVVTGCDIVNSGSAILYLDFTMAATAGSATSIPLQSGQAFHCPYPPLGAVSAVAAQPQSFVAIRY